MIFCGGSQNSSAQELMLKPDLNASKTHLPSVVHTPPPQNFSELTRQVAGEEAEGMRGRTTFGIHFDVTQGAN